MEDYLSTVAGLDAKQVAEQVGEAVKNLKQLFEKEGS